MSSEHHHGLTTPSIDAYSRGHRTSARFAFRFDSASPLPRLQGRVALERVTFRYRPDAPPVLRCENARGRFTFRARWLHD